MEDKNKNSDLQTHLIERPRRNRRSPVLRQLVRENRLSVEQLVWPLFLKAHSGAPEPISSMPGCFRNNLDQTLKCLDEAMELGIRSIALFPALPESEKDALASQSKQPEGLLPSSVRAIKERFPEVCLITDVAMDPYSSDGHDGVVKDGQILNDESLEILAEMALCQAQAGADIVAPSDMMDGRVGFIRNRLDKAGQTQVGILSYAVKYASAYYGPFRNALASEPRCGDKATYQMDPANAKEALREARLDTEEGADILMVKPGLAYLDIISKISQYSALPVAAYNVSGEYAMIKAAAQNNWVDERAVVEETLLSFIRAGAQMIFTYHALDYAKWQR